MMDLIYLDGLPPITRKGGIVRLLIEEGGISQNRIGKIVLNGGLAAVEVEVGWAARLVRALDGAQVETRRIQVWQQTTSSDDHFKQLAHWLALEAQAEKDQRRQTTGNSNEAFTRLVIRGQEIGLGERVLLQLAPRHEQADLPWSQLSVGSPILLTEEGTEPAQSWRGVISRLTRRMVEVALGQAPEPESASATFRLDLASDEIARQRMQRAMTRVEAADGNRTAVLRQVLLGQRTAEFSPQRAFSHFERYTAHLNPSQQTAVQHALAAEDVAVIHGPPGTGKTTTVVALILTAVAQGYRVLACAPSNLAVDNMAERLAAAGANLVRLGHPVRVLPAVQAHTLDALVEGHQDYGQAKKIRKEAFALQNQAGKFRRARPEKGARQAIRQESRALLDEARGLEARTVERILDGASVVLSTLTAIDSTLLGQRTFDLCVIDEAGQSTEPATWIPVPRAQRLVLAGDHQQLPPTVISPQAEREGFGLSLLEQVVQRDGRQLTRQLTVQYRMHEQIMDFSSGEFYEGTLVADAAVARHRLCDLPGVAATELTETAVTFIDTAGANYDEEQSSDSTSYSNPSEAALTRQKVEQLLAAGVSATDIGVITPYSAQVRRLRDWLPDEVEVGSVDGFQGREKEAIIISLVRSNLAGNVGFLAETRRMNVALTRARRKLIVIGDSATITAHPFYERLLAYFDTIGAYHSVWEEADAPLGRV